MTEAGHARARARPQPAEATLAAGPPPAPAVRRSRAAPTSRACASITSGCCCRLSGASGPLSKIEVARLTGLSVQSTSAIMNRLQADGLLKREAPLRGRVGQPTVPMSLDPDGAYSLGLKIGRRSCDLVLVDFRGARPQARPPHLRLSDAGAGSRFRPRALPAARRLADRGRAAPDRRASASPRRSSSGPGRPRSARPPAPWPAGANSTPPSEIEKICPYPVTLCNDATAACAAEFFFGGGWRHRDFLYFFLGAFIGGGLVLDGALRIGSHRQRRRDRVDAGRAAARRQRRAAVDRLRVDLPTRTASRRRRRRRLLDLGDARAWADFGAPLDDWIEDAADGARLRLRRGHLGDRLRGDCHRRRDAGGPSAIAWPRARRKCSRASTGGA